MKTEKEIFALCDLIRETAFAFHSYHRIGTDILKKFK